jgi:hypothetical protein
MSVTLVTVDPRQEHAETIRRASMAITVSLVAGILIGSWVSHRIGRRWSDAVNLLKDLDEAVVRMRTDMRRRVGDATDVGELTVIALDAVQQQRERRRPRGAT